MTYSNRSEVVAIHLELDKWEALERHALALKILLKNVPNVRPGDTLKVDWTFYCTYLEDTAIALEALGSICDDPDVVLDASCPALEEGKILVFEVLTKLKKLIKKVKKRNRKKPCDCPLCQDVYGGCPTSISDKN